MKYICSKCEQETGVPIVVGFPSSETAARSFRGEVYLCGCNFDSKKAELHCLNCDYEWDSSIYSEMIAVIPSNKEGN
jgi:hypothetical protein